MAKFGQGRGKKFTVAISNSAPDERRPALWKHSKNLREMEVSRFFSKIETQPVRLQVHSAILKIAKGWIFFPNRFVIKWLPRHL
jgi:hypothetical protein